MIFYAAIVCLLLTGGAMSARNGLFFYDAQERWGGVCNSGNNMEQSPINIERDSVKENNQLRSLELSDWSTPYNGRFFNNFGFTAQFVPAEGASLPTTTNHLGTYNLREVHYHWGRESREGTEHQIDGESGELEVHFVHRKQGDTVPTQRDLFTVIAVLADVEEDAELEGVWQQLNATPVQDLNSTTSIEGFSFDRLLPESRDYYFYEGSLTAPPCNETVNWFVLKERIGVPGAYLQQLRMLVEEEEEGDNGNGRRLLTTNFRRIQELGDRTVYTLPSSQATLKPLFSMLLISGLVAVKLL